MGALRNASVEVPTDEFYRWPSPQARPIRGHSDPVARVVAQMTQFNDGLEAIKDGISAAGQSYAQPQTLTEQTVAQLRQIIEGLRAVPVQVDIKVVPVQDEKGSIEKMDAPDSPALEFKPEVNQG